MQRARSDSEKEQRRHTFLQVAEELYMEAPDTLPSVSQIVKKAHLAKGTFYLYFKTKEELFLEILEHRYQAWILALQQEVPKFPALTADGLAKLFIAPIRGDVCFMRLASISQTILEANLSSERAVSFKKGLGRLLSDLAKAIETHFGLPHQEILELALECYAAIIGFWQISQLSRVVEDVKSQIPYDFLFPNFDSNIEPMLTHIILGKMEALEHQIRFLELKAKNPLELVNLAKRCFLNFLGKIS